MNNLKRAYFQLLLFTQIDHFRSKGLRTICPTVVCAIIVEGVARYIEAKRQDARKKMKNIRLANKINGRSPNESV